MPTQPKPPSPSSQVSVLLRLLDQAFDHKAWHGPTLRGALRGVSAAQAAARPAAGRHNVWELALHCAYWKYTVWRQLTGAKTGSFPLPGSNWFERPEKGRGGEADWKRELALLGSCHRELRAAVAALRDDQLDARPRGSKYPNRELVMGAASHDLYHAGQVSLVKRLARRGGAEARPGS